MGRPDTCPRIRDTQHLGWWVLSNAERPRDGYRYPVRSVCALTVWSRVETQHVRGLVDIEQGVKTDGRADSCLVLDDRRSLCA